jgi:hypothetical protein
MPQESFQIVDGLIDAWNRRDLHAALEPMLRNARCGPPRRQSRSMATTAWPRRSETGSTRLTSSRSSRRTTPRTAIACSSRCDNALGKGSGLEIEERFYQLFTLRDGKVFRFEDYSEEADALKALEG